MTIYEIKCILNEKRYIGLTQQTFESRIRQHLNQLFSNNHTNCLLQRSFNKYGFESFSFSKILKEKIDSGEFIPNTSGLKSHIAGEFHHSLETRQRLSEFRSGKSYEELMGSEKAIIVKRNKSERQLGENNSFYLKINMQFVKTQLDFGKTLTQIAMELNTNRGTLSYKFKKEYGITAKEYINSIKRRT